VASILGVAATEASRQFAHALSFGITLSLLSNLAQYVCWKCGSRKGSHWNRYGPFYLCALAVPLVIADIVRHLLKDYDMLPPALNQALSEYRNDCDAESVQCLSVAGWLFAIIFTYSGYILLFIGNFWCINFTQKVKEAWKMYKH